MYNKVSICGVDTSKLPVLGEAQNERLLKEVRNGNKIARDELINGNLRLVLSVIQRFTNRGENLDDLFQVGCIGLMKSIDNFDITQNVRFSTYAVPMIIGEIRRYLRDNNSIRVSRSIKDTAYKAMQAKEKLTTSDGKEPRVEEIAKELGIPIEDVVIALESVVSPVSLYDPVYSDGGDTIYVMEQLGDRIGVTKQTISNLERGNPKMTKLQYIAIRSVFESEANERPGEEKENLLKILNLVCDDDENISDEQSGVLSFTSTRIYIFSLSQ